MALPPEYIKRLERDFEEERASLKPLAEGWMKLGERKLGGKSVDITDREIAHHKRVIAMYEDIIAENKNA